ncbi:peptidoglycan-binding domain-containing protein [Leifsonia sp. 22587]|uniref:peptidoglycan-binding domain-containing protein n=1 Tax=Leifsonia sp. 22587 TaxID=3453946 RepID=UPI003F824F35
MSNPGQPTVQQGDTGTTVRRVQRALRRTPNLSVVVDGIFGPATHAAVVEFQQGAGLVPDGIVGPLTWAALPDGGPMPLLHEGTHGPVVSSLQTVLTNGADQWGGVTPGPIDGIFGPRTREAVEAFQGWALITVDGVVGDQTWSVPLHAGNATLESAVGLEYVVS